MKSQNIEICPCCGRRCTSDDLHCGRGKAHFGQTSDNSVDTAKGGHGGHEGHGGHGGHGGAIKDETVKLLMGCGHTLHHGLIERAANEDILSFLTAEEKANLTALLKKCLDAWNNM